MRSRTVDILIAGITGIAAGLALLYTLESKAQTDRVKLWAFQGLTHYFGFADPSSKSPGGDSPIWIAGGSLSVYTQNQWSYYSGGATGATGAVQTKIGDGLGTHYYIIMDGVAAIGPGVTSWFGVNVPWSIYLHGRYNDGRITNGSGPPTYGLKLCQRIMGAGTASQDCDLTNTFSSPLAVGNPVLIPVGSAQFYKTDYYGTLLGDGGLSFDLRRYRYYPSNANDPCLEANGGLCEHVGQIDVSFETVAGLPPVTNSYRCLFGTCSIRIGAYVPVKP